MHVLERALHAFFSEMGVGNAKTTYVIGYSGGLDSHVLLSIAAYLRKLDLRLKLHAIHINHGLHPKACEWQSHCSAVCAAADIPFSAERITITGQGNIEAKAREQRYSVFAKALQKEDILLTAHHENDQVETVLLQLLRGAGPLGLAAMPRIKPFANGYHARPLLRFTRTELEAYAQLKQLQWIDDDSNAQLHFARNHIRHDIMPKLSQYWPSAVKTMARSASHCAEFQQLLVAYAHEDRQKVRGSCQETLSIARLKLLSPPKQRLMLRLWLVEREATLPSSRKLDEMIKQLLTAKTDRNPRIAWDDVEVRRYKDDLYLIATTMHDHHADAVHTWRLSEELSLPGVGRLCAQITKGQGIRLALDTVSVRYRRQGEIIHVPKRGRRDLKRLLQEWGVKPWLRNRLPLIFDQDTLISAVGYYINPAYLVQHEHEDGYSLQLV